MRRPTTKLIVFFIVALLAGYAVSFVLMTLVLQAPLYLYGFGNVTIVAVLVAILLTVWLDKPLDLGLFKWPAPKPKAEKKPAPPVVVQPEGGTSPEAVPQPQLIQGGLFPYEAPSEHWAVDFSDGEQVYQGADLPIWILAGWAVFIIWAVVYLFSGLETLPF